MHTLQRKAKREREKEKDREKAPPNVSWSGHDPSPSSLYPIRTWDTHAHMLDIFFQSAGAGTQTA